MSTLQKKIDQAIHLLQSIHPEEGETLELAYSGGKDSDVILTLARMAKINFTPRYKNTTIDPPRTIAHARENGCIITPPPKGTTFFSLIREKGTPNMFARFCCSELKEYYTARYVITGVRRSESRKRAALYHEPTYCRVFSKKKRTEMIMPILEWTDEDVHQFIQNYNVKLHPLYYREDGTIDVQRRLGCMCCPLASNRKRREQFKQYPNMLRQYVRNLVIFMHTHPECKVSQRYPKGPCQKMYRDLFFNTQQEFENFDNGTLFLKPTEDWYRTELEDYFNVNLTFTPQCCKDYVKQQHHAHKETR